MLVSEPRAPLPNDLDEFERELRALGAVIVFPATPDVTAGVLAGIETGPRSIQAGGRNRRWMAIAAVIVLAVVAAFGLSRGLRSVVADWIGVRGVRIEFVRETPAPRSTSTPATPATGAALLLGRQVSAVEARAAAPFVVRFPVIVGIGSPDETYVRVLPGGDVMISTLYRPRANLPEVAGSGVGLLLMQFPGRDDVIYLTKVISEGYAPVQTTVNGHQAFWITGTHQLTLLPDPSRGCCESSTRDAGNVLLWEENGVTFRLESALSFADAMAIAESLSAEVATPSAARGN